MIVFNHMIACYFFPQERKEKPDNPPPVPISSSVCGTTMTSASISSRVGCPRCIPQTSATYTECVISCHFLCRPARSLFASWFCIFADSRGMVTFCNIRLWFRLWECTLVGTFSPSLPSLHDLPCLTSATHHGWMDGFSSSHSLLMIRGQSMLVPCKSMSMLSLSPFLQLRVVLFQHTTFLPWSFQFFLSWFLGLLILSLLLLLLLLPVLTTVSLSYAFLTSPPTPCIPHLVCLFCSYCSQTCLIYPFSPPSLSLSCWRSGFLSQFTFLPLHRQISFLAFLDLRWVTAAPCYLIPTTGMVQNTGDGSSPCWHWSPDLDLTWPVSPVKLWMIPEWEHEITENGVQVALPTMLKEHLSLLLE